MPVISWLLAAAVSLIAGLDRTAAAQIMLARPLVCAPLTGLLLGDVSTGLLIGSLLELLWIGRIPVGAAIPPDDTQMAIAATTLAIAMPYWTPFSGTGYAIVCLLMVLPLGRIGQPFDRLARKLNLRLIKNAEAGVEIYGSRYAARMHLLGMLHFALVSLVSWLLIVVLGAMLVYYLGPLLVKSVTHMEAVIILYFPLVGCAFLLGSVRISRSLSLFSASYISALLLLQMV